MNVEIGAEAAQFPEKEYINGNAVVVQLSTAGYHWSENQLSNISHSISSQVSFKTVVQYMSNGRVHLTSTVPYLQSSNLY
jgi:hypothetical protein